ncbi:MAG TPA: APC family permease [Chloroflexota bacterium]|nr:APC family permease [Chloroflexota bacterium]
MAEAATAGPGDEGGLRRAVGPWGSYTWGYADVGADIYVALGLVIATAGGSSNVAFLFAGLIYASIGLAYTELAAMYPLSGGGQLWVMRGLGDIFGFTAGWSVLLAFTVDIALFAYISISYLDRFFPALNHPPYNIVESIVMVGLLLTLNTIGVRESSKLNEMAGALDIFAESTIIVIGFAFAFWPYLYWSQISHFWGHFQANRLMFGTSLAIISFVGLESISQAAQETERPTTIIPRTSLALILTILAYAIGLSNLALGVVPWQTYDPTSHVYCHGLSVAACSASHLAHENAPMIWLAEHLPLIGAYLAPVVAVLGTTLLMISSNSGVYGSSRIVYSMAHNDLMPKFFTYVQPKFRTPLVALVVFCLVAVGELIAAGFTSNALESLAQMYAFSAAVNYLLVFVSLLVLRFTDTATPRTFRMPWNVALRRPDRTYDIPISGVVGLLFLVAVLVMVVITNAIGRVAGPLWVVAGLVFYVLYRTRRHLPLLRSCPRDWSAMQLEVYHESGETGLAQEYQTALRRNDRRGYGSTVPALDLLLNWRERRRGKGSTPEGTQT